jgi:hypothetical protein
MKRVLFVTVGTSAITAEHLWKEVPQDGRLRRDIASFVDVPEGRQEELSGTFKLRPRLIAAHWKFWHGLKDRAPLREDYRRTSAELVTTLGLLGSKEGAVADFFRRDGCEDTILLLASNTVEGELAAGVNAQVLHELLRGKHCECKGEVRNCRRIVVEVIRGMETATRFEGLLDGLLDKVKGYDGAQSAFNFTGGFKGVIPYITWLALVKFPGAPMYYQQEKMENFMRIVLELPKDGVAPCAPVLKEMSVQPYYGAPDFGN